jgi:hypothetical protein
VEREIRKRENEEDNILIINIILSILVFPTFYNCVYLANRNKLANKIKGGINDYFDNLHNGIQINLKQIYKKN